ncbi:HVA22-like protein i [Pistacia vera]|uniref:HVA22-like protein i n=1 Tax=Pistacia vera TaxID=55513 RepID=UPI001263370C|nr:HVA22-like protein i [Pistacia vera]
MMGSFLSRALLMVFGYAYPAYECFKSVEKKTPEIDQLLFWCQYWILVAMFTVGERVGDAFISWLPMYNEAKLAFFTYLWYPKTKGTSYVYNFLLRPYVSKHETEIDRNLLEVNVKAKEIGLLLWQEAASYGHTKFCDILLYFSTHSASQPQPFQPPG